MRLCRAGVPRPPVAGFHQGRSRTRHPRVSWPRPPVWRRTLRRPACRPRARRCSPARSAVVLRSLRWRLAAAAPGRADLVVRHRLPWPWPGNGRASALGQTLTHPGQCGDCAGWACSLVAVACRRRPRCRGRARHLGSQHWPCGAIAAALPRPGKRRGMRPGWQALGVALCRPALALPSSGSGRSTAIGLAVLVWMLALVMAVDTGAYAAGRSIGGPKLAPRISPNKTWAGLGGGIAGGHADRLRCRLSCWSLPASWPLVLVSGVLAVVEQGGDLAGIGVQAALRRQGQQSAHSRAWRRARPGRWAAGRRRLRWC